MYKAVLEETLMRSYHMDDCNRRAVWLGNFIHSKGISARIFILWMGCMERRIDQIECF